MVASRVYSMTTRNELYAPEETGCGTKILAVVVERVT